MWIIGAMLLSCGIGAQVSQPRLPNDYFERMKHMSEAVQGKVPATEAEIQDLLATAMRDPHPRIRSNAVGIVASILTVTSVPQTPPGQEWAGRLRGVGEALRPQLEHALNDPDGQVRREAIRGIVGAFLYSKPGSPLPLEMLRMLAVHYEKYPDQAGRAMIVSALQSSYTSNVAEARAISLRVVTQALQDQDPFVVQAAGHSATRAGAPELLPLLVAQLKNPSYVARMGVSQGIASYGAAARPYLPQLEAALAAETHDVTRKTIAGTIAVITR